MKKLYKSIVIVLGLLVSFSGVSQFKVTRVTGQNVNTTQDGFYYSLPRTVLEVNAVYEKLQQYRGPLADYAEDYLGTSSDITSNNTKYRILDVQVNTTVEADPNQLFYVEFPAEKSKDEKEMVFQLSSLGTLLAFDEMDAKPDQSVPHYTEQTFIMMEGDDEFKYHADYNRKKKIDTITRRITIDTISIDRFIFKTTWVDKSTEDKAEEAAQQLSRIRESRFNLITGYQEVNYGESMAYMDRQLKNLENKYLELFLGKEVKTIENQTVYYTPDKDVTTGNLIVLPDGSSINISLNKVNSTANLPPVPLEKTDNIYYRIPDNAVVGISHNGDTYYQKSIIINQLGVISAAPMNRARTQFDPKTGSLIKVIRE